MVVFEVHVQFCQGHANNWDASKHFCWSIVHGLGSVQEHRVFGRVLTHFGTQMRMFKSFWDLLRAKTGQRRLRMGIKRLLEHPKWSGITFVELLAIVYWDLRWVMEPREWPGVL